MKIRTNFVTNSSSSCFIFKENPKNEIEVAVERYIATTPIIEEGQNFEEDERQEHEEAVRQTYEDVRKFVKSMNCKRFCEYEISELLEVAYFYKDDILRKLFGITLWKDLSEHAVNLTEDAKKRLAAKFIIDMYDFLDGQYYPLDEEKLRTVSIELLKKELWEYLASLDRRKVIVKFYLENLDMILTTAKEFDGKLFGEVVECFLDAKYLFFRPWQIPIDIYMVMFEALENEDNYVASCHFMG